MSDITRHEMSSFFCQRCKKPDAEISGLMIGHPEGRWVWYDDYARLKAEVERLTLLQVETLNERNKAETDVERLRKAGDALVQLLDHMDVVMDMNSDHPEVEAWNAAKEGKPKS